MDWSTPVLLSLLPAVLLLVQGGSCLRGDRPSFVRWFGVVAITVAALDVVLALLLITGTLAPSREFAAVMVKGTLPSLGLTALLVGLPLMVGLGWHVARTAAGQPSRLRWLLVAGLLVGASAVYRVDVLNPEFPAHARVYTHELLWPPLLLWVGFCFVEACYAILRLQSRAWRLWADTALVVAPAVWALESSWPVAADVKSAWSAALILCLTLSTGLGVWLAAGVLAPRRCRWPLRLGLSVAGAAIGLWIAVHWLPGDTRPLTSWLVWPGSPAVVAALGLRTAWRLRRAGSLDGSLRPPVRPRQILSFVALVFIAASFAELVYFGFLDPVVPLVVFMVAVAVQAEATTRGPLTLIWQLAPGRQLWGEGSPLRRWTVSGGARLRTLKDHTIVVAKTLLALPSVPVAIGKFLVLVLALIVIVELPNAGQTVVEPFATHVKEDGAIVPLGQRISDRVLNEVALIDQRLRPDTVRLLPRGSEVEPSFKLVAGATTAGLDATFARGNELDLGYVKVPATFVLAVTRDPIRALMGVRVISGTVQQGPRGHDLLARSSTGETWRIEPTIAVAHETPASVELVNELAEKLAFEIVIGTDRTMRIAGLTHSWKAYKDFRKGLEHWQEFETGQRVEDLSAAIRSFREATRNHPSFALAFYRLGLALQRDAQPAAAAEALRASLRINEDLVAAYLALASTLYDHDKYLALMPTPAVAPATPVRDAGAGGSRAPRPEVVSLRAEARALWLHVIRRPPHTVSLADRASAFYGLCRSAQDDEAFGTRKDPGDRLRRLAYYYCRRADHLYAALPPAERASAPIKEAQASVLNDLGRALTWRFERDTSIADNQWRCRRDDSLPGGPLRAAALGYLERAEALAPLNEAIRCRTASVALALGRRERMDALKFDASARVRLADRLARRAKRQASAEARVNEYRRALEEYADAIELNPTLFPALNGFASAVWVWRLNWPGDAAAAAYAHEAETHARRALEVAKERRSREDTIVATATLGNVLLAQARPLEAIEHLREANALAPDHARWNEVRWSLAQAYLCANTNDGATRVSEGKTVRREHALPLLDTVRRIEETREGGPFSSIPAALDPAPDYHVCRRNPTAIVDRQPAADGPLYVLAPRSVRYEPNRLCDRMGVRADRGVHPDQGADLRDVRNRRVVLRVWGGGVSREIELDAPQHLSVQLHSPPRATHHYYFVQLEDDKGAPVSEVFPLTTFDEAGGRCTRNLIRLVYVRER
jgi:tetratricopeptide (TPR) repeat protein